jgi:hypothetical protein
MERQRESFLSDRGRLSRPLGLPLRKGLAPGASWRRPARGRNISYIENKLASEGSNLCVIRVKEQLERMKLYDYAYLFRNHNLCKVDTDFMQN